MLAFHNVTTNVTKFQAFNESWYGDAQWISYWNESATLEAAHATFAKVNGSAFRGFVWRAMVYPCITEPVFVFSTTTNDPEQLPFVYVGSKTNKACKSPIMITDPSNKPPCYADCYH